MPPLNKKMKPVRVLAALGSLLLLSAATHAATPYTMRVQVPGLKNANAPVSSSVGIVLQNGARQWADGNFAKNCNEYRNPGVGRAYSGSVGDGVYTVSGSGVPVPVACDMSTDGGGWTKVAVATTSNRNHILTSSSPWTAAVGSGSEAGKLSDAAINALKSTSSASAIAYRLTVGGVTNYFPGSCAFVANTTASADCRTYTTSFSATPAWVSGASTDDGCPPPTYYTGLVSLKHAACSPTSFPGSGDLIYGRIGNSPTNGMSRGTPYTTGLAGQMWVR